jgi:hypothetical protein
VDTESMTDIKATSPPPEDPLLRSARREAFITAGLVLAALVYTITYSVLFGYDRAPESLTFVFGIPDWVFWGILAPWLVCLLASWWFAFGLFEDDTLERAEPTPTDGSSEFAESPGDQHSAAGPFRSQNREGS